MPTIFTKGDLLHTEGLRAFAHGSNVAGAMDTGVSHALKTRWPAMAEDYQRRCAEGHVHTGDAVAWSDGADTVFTLALQEHASKKAKLSAVVHAVAKMIERASALGIDRIGVPRLGAGAAGLEWKRVKDVLVEAGAATDVTLVVFEQFVRDKTKA